MSEVQAVIMNYRAQLLHLKGQRKQKSKHEPKLESYNNRNIIDVISRLIVYELDHITIKV